MFAPYRSKILCASLGVLLLSSCSQSGAGKGQSRSIETEQEAVAALWTRLCLVAKPRTASKVPLPRYVARIPFLGWRRNALAWRLQGDMIGLTPTNPYLDTFEVFLRPEDGALLLWRSLPTPMNDSMDSDTSSCQQKDDSPDSGDLNSGIPRTEPLISISELIQLAREKGLINPDIVTDITIRRIMLGNPTWLINAKGVTMPLKGSAGSFHEINCTYTDYGDPQSCMNGSE